MAIHPSLSLDHHVYPRTTLTLTFDSVNAREFALTSFAVVSLLQMHFRVKHAYI